MTVPTSEQRRYSRIPFHVQVHLSGEPGTASVALIDVSLRGALVERPAHWKDIAPGSAMALAIRLGQDEDMLIVMQTQVVHSAGGHLGLHCVHIDLDSVTQLRRLVAMNLGDAALLDRELAALG